METAVVLLTLAYAAVSGVVAGAWSFVHGPATKLDLIILFFCLNAVITQAYKPIARIMLANRESTDKLLLASEGTASKEQVGEVQRRVSNLYDQIRDKYA